VSFFVRVYSPGYLESDRHPGQIFKHWHWEKPKEPSPSTSKPSCYSCSLFIVQRPSWHPNGFVVGSGAAFAKKIAQLSVVDLMYFLNLVQNPADSTVFHVQFQKTWQLR